MISSFTFHKARVYPGKFPFLIMMALLLLPGVCHAAGENAKPPFLPVYRIPLRVHLGSSSRAPAEWQPILEEINSIWLSQAGICFEIHTVAHDDELERGLDLWFEATIPQWNGFFIDLHDMHVRDDPELRPAANPAKSSAARTAAHELGHALNLGHRQASDDNLMRSKTYGWFLHSDEITSARAAASRLALKELSPGKCGPILIHNHP